MKKVLLLLLVSICSFSAQAQLDVTIDMPQTEFLQYEAINVQVTLHNVSGNRLVFSEKNEDHLEFRIMTPTGIAAKPLGKIGCQIDGLELPPGKKRSFIITTSLLYSLQTAGAYTIKADVKHSQLSSGYSSQKLNFKVSEGKETWSYRVGLPKKEGQTNIEHRIYKFISLQNSKDALVFYLRIEDDTKVYLVRQIGARKFSATPQLKVDDENNLHLLLKDTAKVYRYLKFDPEGTQLEEQYYMHDPGQPFLTLDPDIGRVTVAGGRLGIEGVDYKKGDIKGLVPSE